jgi:hypothetical protein
VNISTRDLVGTGDDVMVNAFTITGFDPKQVIVRSLGPSLSGVGISNPLADPVLELHGPGGFVTLTNNNWRDTQEAEILATGLAPTNDLESAIIATLLPGSYTTVLRGNGGGTGVGVNELYDLASGGSSHLTAVGTRGAVLMGADVLISGIILHDGGDILVRALGPSMSGAGVVNTLQDPILQFHDSNGAQLASNDNWRGSQEAEIIATGIPPQDDREAALLTNVSAGLYTAVVAGVNNTTGIGYVQFYALPHSGPVLPLTP